MPISLNSKEYVFFKIITFWCTRFFIYLENHYVYLSIYAFDYRGRQWSPNTFDYKVVFASNKVTLVYVSTRGAVGVGIDL